jgi:hypothetical protein
MRLGQGQAARRSGAGPRSVRQLRTEHRGGRRREQAAGAEWQLGAVGARVSAGIAAEQVAGAGEHLAERARRLVRLNARNALLGLPPQPANAASARSLGLAELVAGGVGRHLPCENRSRAAGARPRPWQRRAWRGRPNQFIGEHRTDDYGEHGQDACANNASVEWLPIRRWWG